MASSESDSGNESRETSRSPSPLALSREKRATAGNLMRFLLDEESMQEHLAADEFFAEVENDQAFMEAEDDSGESNEFDSDFESTDDEFYMNEGIDGLRNEHGQPLDGNEEEQLQQVRAARKLAREKAKGYAPVVKRAGDRRVLKKKTSENQDSVTDSPRKRAKHDSSSQEQIGRKSARASTVLATSRGVIRRTEESLLRKAIQSSKNQAPLPSQNIKSQADLIADALDMEEYNRASLQQFYAQEEDRREKGKKVKVDPLEGHPFLRFWSRTCASLFKCDNASTNSSVIKESITQSGPSTTSVTQNPEQKCQVLTLRTGEVIEVPPVPTILLKRVQKERTLSFTTQDSSVPSIVSNTEEFETDSANIKSKVPDHENRESVSIPSAKFAVVDNDLKELQSTICRKDAIGDQSDKQSDKNPKCVNSLSFMNLHPPPDTFDMMNHMFPYASWRNVKVVTAKYKPREKSRTTCSITGMIAKYRDPLTGVPYANLEAFKIIRQIAADEWAWDPDCGLFSKHIAKPVPTLGANTSLPQKAQHWAERYGSEFDCLEHS